MNVQPLSGRTGAVRDALLSHGWEGELARLSDGGAGYAAYHIQDVPAETIEAMLSVAARLGIEIITGDDWLILAGARSRLGAFARPWVQPEPVQQLAAAVGMAMTQGVEMTWRHARGQLALDGPVLVGIVNVTPDSFSDGGSADTVTKALHRVAHLMAGGASIVDVGGESTRPGAAAVDRDVEIARVVPVVRAIAQRFPSVPISIDTVHSHTARAALGEGAAIINDVTAGRHDPGIFDVAAAAHAGIVLSHSRGALAEIASYVHAEYQHDVTGAVVHELRTARERATAAGLAADAIVLDPGFGFGKVPAQSWSLLSQLDALVALDSPVMVGVSRKRFLGDVTGRDVQDRDRATAAACALAYQSGARLFRVHDPDAVRDALAVAAATARSE